MFKTKLTEEQLIEQMHNEFDTAPERLLQEALEIISQNEKNKVGLESDLEDKAQKLSELGFTSSKVVTKLQEIQKRNEKKDEVIQQELARAQMIKEYKLRFPNNKFLTVDELNRICKKYGLVYAPVEHYTETVPDKNIEEIQNNTPIINDDCRAREIITASYSIRFSSWHHSVTEEQCKFWDNPITFECSDTHKSIETRLGNALKAKYDTGYKEISFKNDIECSIQNRDGLFIAAPKNHFNTKDLTFDNKYGFFSITKKVHKIKTDPVVFKFVKDGALIITKWGLVGEDPLLKL